MKSGFAAAMLAAIAFGLPGVAHDLAVRPAPSAVRYRDPNRSLPKGRGRRRLTSRQSRGLRDWGRKLNGGN